MEFLICHWELSTCPKQVQAITSLTSDGMEELEQMLADTRRSTEGWNDFLKAFVDDEELIARVNAKSPR